MPLSSHRRFTVVQLVKATLIIWYDIAGDIQSLDSEETKVEYGAEDDTQVVDIEEAKVEYGAEDML
jgi:hypothetical protein